MSQDVNIEESKLLHRLNTPAKVQDYLETLPINFSDDTLYSPRTVIQKQTAHCFEGALFAAAALEYHGHKPLILDLKTTDDDDSHVIALFKEHGCWGAITKTNHAVLRYREPVYKNIHELVMSFFHEYFLNSGEKTLRAYSRLLNLAQKRFFGWQIAEGDVWNIDRAFDELPYTNIITPAQIKKLRSADLIEIEAGKLVVWKDNTKKKKH